MELGLTIYFIFTLFISFYNIYLRCKIVCLDNFSEVGIIKSQEKEGNEEEDGTLTTLEKLIVIAFISNYFYLIISSIVFIVIETMPPTMTLVWVVFLIVFNTKVASVFEKKLSKLNSVKRYFLPKNITIPQAIVDLRLDIYAIKDSTYLKSYRYPNHDLDMISEFESMRRKYTVINFSAFDNKKTNFPLYIGFLALEELLNDKHLVNVSPMLYDYLIDNIPTLTAMTTILKDEKLVSALSSEEGFNDLLDISTELYTIVIGLENVVIKLKKCKINVEKYSEHLEVIEGLNEVRSIRSFSKSIK